MADRGFLLVAVPLVFGCAAEPQPLLLDTVCHNVFSQSGVQSESCTVSGDVELTSGVSKNVIAVRFGPSGVGELRIRLNAITASTQQRWSLEALVASTRPEGSTLFRSLTWGSCGATCPADPADVQATASEDFEWVRVIDDYEGGTFDPSAFQPIPDDAALIFRGADIDLIDIATPGFDGQTRNDFFL